MVAGRVGRDADSSPSWIGYWRSRRSLGHVDQITVAVWGNPIHKEHVFEGHVVLVTTKMRHRRGSYSRIRIGNRSVIGDAKVVVRERVRIHDVRRDHCEE